MSNLKFSGANKRISNVCKGSFNNHVDKKRGEGVQQMSTIVHVREERGQSNVHMDKILKKMDFWLLK